MCDHTLHVMRRIAVQSVIGMVWAFTAAAIVEAAPIVIAHRGASGYVPEHSLAAKALAHGQGADFIEQDIVLTRDDVPIVVHDIQLDTVSDVAEVFPGRAREDGRFYAIDFTLDEVRRLRIRERRDPRSERQVYPVRFPTTTDAAMGKSPRSTKNFTSSPDSTGAPAVERASTRRSRSLPGTAGKGAT